MLEARVKQDYFLGSVQAFSGREYIKLEWRPVPKGYEKQAQANELLEVRETGPVESLPETEIVADVVEEAELEPEMDNTTRKRRKKKTEEGEG